MEASSPLAALHRPVPALPWSGGEHFRMRSHAHPHFSTAAISTASMSLREQLHKGPSDYFNAKDLRGSSPAASLAADISQNFRLDSDASPRFPTPRRALFTSDMMGGLEGRGQVTTPPLPSSSPGPLVELMEMSPLPHKVPVCAQIEVTSPTPLSTPAEEDMLLDSPAPITRQGSLEQLKPVVSERKIAAPRRPSLTRMKGFSTSAVPARVQSDSQLPVFRFGAESPFSSNTSTLSLDMCFDSASPPQQRRPHSATTPCAAIPLGLRSRPQFSSMNSCKNGSPINSHARRQSNPFLRNRKQFRRSLSMFEHPADIMKPKQEVEESASTALQSVMDLEEPEDPVLPHFLLDDPTDSIPRISKETLLDVLDGKYMDKFDQKMVIDCRFEYEYEGGHIDGAVNYNDKELLATQLLGTPMTGRTLLVFHCEYSAHRAPLMARHVRSQDRMANAEFYPKLSYPEVYILHGGYSAFFAAHRGRCFPPEYVEMSDAKHQRTCEREMGRLKSRKGFARAQTFAFGQREHCVEDSPTGPTRPNSRHTPISLLGESPIPAERSHTRRMVSY
ncbi:hypothetical protein S7711_05320 [Stachybotrys chartarum IBT 7711]|uniref:M-phase inducer phosphatase n=1 Tax=Stachybotrys chartarum (strain CBS 109288 / IBT 7711) TaxID=1280523 RepID=A0A084ALH1_STACB|nr:hypothetical protein S7711_05320 [Stachybotrys chartarum IBT 7711]